MSFKSDYDHWARNRYLYSGIHPDHNSKRWDVSVMRSGQKMGGYADSLKQAKRAVTAFRKSGESK